MRDQIIKGYFYADYTYVEIIDLLKKFHNISISIRTLIRSINKLRLKRKNKDENLHDIVNAIIEEMRSSGCSLGYKTLWRRLKQFYKLEVKRSTVLEVLHLIDPDGVSDRLRYRLKRRLYKVAGPNFIWHQDGYDKLKPFGFAIHGAIDGFSRKIMWLEVATTNNNPRVVAYYFLKTLKKFQLLPTLIRSDNGTENCMVEIIQKALRHNHDDNNAGEYSFLTGKSTANQRIESWWNQLRRNAAGFWTILFKEMRDKGIFNNANFLHVESLRYCFGPAIQMELNLVRKEWNRHKIRKQRGREVVPGKPNMLFYVPEKFGATDCKKPYSQADVDICIEEYAEVPQLVDQNFSELVRILLPDIETPTNAEEALYLYDRIQSVFELNGIDGF